MKILTVNTNANTDKQTTTAAASKRLVKLAAMVLLPTLVACGGGGGGGSEAPNSASPTAATPVPTPPSSPDPIAISSTADLTVDQNFDLATESTVRLETDLTTLSAHRGYLSVCSDFEVSNNQVSFVNYDSCLLRTRVEQNGYQQSLAVTHDINALVAAVWYPGLESVDYSVWERADGMQWLVNSAN